MFTNMFIWAATFMYISQIIMYIGTKNYPQAMMLGGYVLANVGLIWSIDL